MSHGQDQPPSTEGSTDIHYTSPVQYATLALVGLGMLFGAWGKCDSERKFHDQQSQIDEIRAAVLERGTPKR